MEPAKGLISLLAVLLMMTVSPPIRAADNIVMPQDVPTIEALIDAHKYIVKAELASLAEAEVIRENTSWTKRAVTAYNKTRSELNKRLSDGISYLRLANQIVTLGLKLKNLIENYTDFTTYSFQYTVKKPYVLVYYYRANRQLKKEIEHLKELLVSLGAANFNLIKATMEERYQLLTRIGLSIAAMNRIINNNEMICRSVVRNGLKMYHIKDFLGEETNELRTQKLISRWDKEQE